MSEGPTEPTESEKKKKKKKKTNGFLFSFFNNVPAFLDELLRRVMTDCSNRNSCQQSYEARKFEIDSIKLSSLTLSSISSAGLGFSFFFYFAGGAIIRRNPWRPFFSSFFFGYRVFTEFFFCFWLFFPRIRRVPGSSESSTLTCRFSDRHERDNPLWNTLLIDRT